MFEEQRRLRPKFRGADGKPTAKLFREAEINLGVHLPPSTLGSFARWPAHRVRNPPISRPTSSAVRQLPTVSAP